jgi:plastocyanin
MRFAMMMVVTRAMLCVAVSAPAAYAQGQVAGQITLLEAKSTAKHDVASAVVYLEPVNRRGAEYSRPVGEYSSASIDMRNREFVPHIQIVRAGGTVEFPNSDPFSHNVFSNTSLGAFDLGLYRRGQSRSTTFARAGVYSIYCNIHSAMVSFVIAVPTRDFSRVAADGKFAMEDVPAGSYFLHVWHERTPEIVEQIDVPAAGLRTLAVTLDTRGFAATAHLNKFGKPYAPTRADRY